MIYKTINLLMKTEEFDKELSVIKHIAIDNNYKKTVIDSILKLYNQVLK